VGAARRAGRQQRASKDGLDRLRWLTILTLGFAGLLVIRFFSVQVVQHGFYTALAQGQHSIFQKLFPERGEILAREPDGSLFPLATNRDLNLLYAVPTQVEKPEEAAKALAPLLGKPEDELLPRLSKADDIYEPLAHELNDDQRAKIEALNLKGIAFAPERTRYYPDGPTAGHLLGFWGFSGDERQGQYGLEGYFENELKGSPGHLAAERDAGGRLIPIGDQSFVPAQNGDDIILTIDRTVQFKACSALSAAVERHGASGGSLIILDPKTGKILALCGAPTFDPNNYREVEDISAYLNPAVNTTYEPGSVMKAITMAAAIDQGKVTPDSTYVDEGKKVIGKYTIKNSDGKAHGVQTMTQVLEESLNTGAIYAMEQVGPETFRRYIQNFGFGAKTGLTLAGEGSGNISSLSQKGEIYPATGSFGQGITTTPIQLAQAFGAIANHGMMMKPYLVDEIVKAGNVRVKTEPVSVRQVISSKTATTISAMLANVVKNGHGTRAAVPGYFIAGKTGTAQIPLKDRAGYDPDNTIGTFAGFGPVEDPRFVMIVKIDEPKDVQFAESTAAPLFGEVATFLLHYLDIPPTILQR
jgi:cell division protein FtsI/penicillin-binding protein 2